MPKYGGASSVLGAPYEESIYNSGSGLRKPGVIGGTGSGYHSISTAEIPIVTNNNERNSPSSLGAADGERAHVKVNNPPGGKSSLNLGGYGGSPDDEPKHKKIGGGARTGGRLQVGNHSALRQYDMNTNLTGGRANNISSNTNNQSLHYPLNAPRNHAE